MFLFHIFSYYIIKIIRFSKPGDIILDPFMGIGSTAIACKQLKRNFIGCEINKTYVNCAEKRLA